MSTPELLRAVRESVGDYYDVIGELGEREPGGVFYLAREVGSSQLVALKLAKSGQNPLGGAEFTLDIALELDASVPDVESECPRCHHRIRRWARLCTQCGLDVSGVSPSASSSRVNRDALLEAARRVAGEQFDVLGDMARKAGGGLVYFAREIATGRVVALRLTQEQGSDYALGVTRVLRPLPDRVATPRTPQRSLSPARGTSKHGPVSIVTASVERMLSALPQQRDGLPDDDVVEPGVGRTARSLTPFSMFGTGEYPVTGRRRVVIGVVVLAVVLLVLAIVGR